MAAYYQPLAPATFYHCQIPLPNFTAKFRRSIQIPQPHPKTPPTKIRHPTQNATQKAKFNPTKSQISYLSTQNQIKIL
ncbi:hypothetical protein [Campylobacter lanienae]|uniref:hypothetical protein n=1 Tax=Campylobacter lanienae TaxID=75658 RepID=UPI00112F05F6|nr:hypothetical protein [Campylobacter lanienae]